MALDPETSAAEGEWLLHEGPGPYSGWLYRYADGTLVSEDGTVLEYADPEPAQEPGPEPEPSTASQSPRWVFHDSEDYRGWLFEHEDGRLVADDGTEVRGATPLTADEPEPEPETEPEPERAGAVPSYLRWETSVLPQYAAGAVFLAAAIGAVLLVITSLSTTTDPGRLTTGVALALLAGAALYGISVLAPTTVTVRDATVTVARGDRETTFDLTDPETRADLEDKTRSASWRARLRSPSGDVEVLRRTQVQPGPFSDVVRHHLAARETGA